MKIREAVTLSNHTTIGIGGVARYFATAKSNNELKDLLSWANLKKIPSFIISGGSNVIFSDKGYNGLIIKLETKGLKTVKKSDTFTHLKVAAGENWDDFVQLCIANKLQGIEFLSGIPGSVGASPIQNIGAYGQEVSETIISVGCIDKNNLQKFFFANKECSFEYRNSIFKKRPRLIITSVVFKLKKTNTNLELVRKNVLKQRKLKSMLISSKDPNSKGVGSFFKNPLITQKKLNTIQKNHPYIKFWKIENKYKLPAAWLIEQAGFKKGYRHNIHMGLSDNHALAIVNKKHASSKDVLVFAKKIQSEVYKKFSVRLTPEPTLEGFSL